MIPHEELGVMTMHQHTGKYESEEKNIRQLRTRYGLQAEQVWLKQIILVGCGVASEYIHQSG